MKAFKMIYIYIYIYRNKLISKIIESVITRFYKITNFITFKKSSNKDFKPPQKVLKIFCIIFTFPFFIFALITYLLYFYDPLQIFHKPILRPITFSSDTRVQNLGIIKFYDFDSIIIGSSMLLNTRSSWASDILDLKFMNLSMSNSRFIERKVILDYALQHKQIKHIIYSLDDYLIFNTDKDTSSFDFLYKNDNAQNIRIYLNGKFIACALTWSLDGKCVGQSKDIDNIAAWADYKRNIMGLDNWIYYNFEFQQPILKKLAFNDFPHFEIIDSKNAKIFKENMTENIIDLIRKHPHITFSIILPTYSRLYYRQITSKYYADIKANLKWFIREVNGLSNVRIYGFDDLSYADNLDNYRDLNHYNVDMNALQLDSILKQTHIINAQNMDAYFRILDKKILDFNVAPLVAKLQKYKWRYED